MPPSLMKAVSAINETMKNRRRRLKLMAYSRSKTAVFEAKRCLYCNHLFEPGQGAFVNDGWTVLIHVDCVKEMAELTVDVEEASAMEFKRIKERIEKTGAFYG